MVSLTYGYKKENATRVMQVVKWREEKERGEGEEEEGREEREEGREEGIK